MNASAAYYTFAYARRFGGNRLMTFGVAGLGISQFPDIRDL
jgi:hypothetical protein